MCSSSLSADTPALRDYFLPDSQRSALRLILLALHQLELLLQPEGEGFLGEVTIKIGGILGLLPLVCPSIHSPLQTQNYKISNTSAKCTYTGVYILRICIESDIHIQCSFLSKYPG